MAHNKIIVTPEDNKRIKRKTDLRILTIITLTYWLQQVPTVTDMDISD